jgi:hypothetical protein
LDIATITIEFFSDTEQHLKILEHELKRVHDVDVYLIEPKDPQAPALVSIGVNKSGERAAKAAQNIARVLHDFIHDTSSPGQKKILLFTIEGDRVDIEPLSVEEIERIIVAAKEDEPD